MYTKQQQQQKKKKKTNKHQHTHKNTITNITKPFTQDFRPKTTAQQTKQAL